MTMLKTYMAAMTSCKDHEPSTMVQYPSLLATLFVWVPLKFQAFLFLQNVIEVAFAAGVEPALNSMIADRSRGNEDIRGDGFAALGVIMHLSDTLERWAVGREIRFCNSLCLSIETAASLTAAYCCIAPVTKQISTGHFQVMA